MKDPIVTHLASMVKNRGVVTHNEVYHVCGHLGEAGMRKAIRKLKKYKIEYKDGVLKYSKKGGKELVDKEFPSYWTKQVPVTSTSESVSIGTRIYEGLVATGYPEHIKEDWLGKVVNSEEHFDFTLFIAPEQLSKVDLFLQNRLKAVEDEIYMYTKKNLSDAALEKKKKELSAKANSLKKGEFELYSVRLYLCSKGINEDKAKEVSKKVVSLLHRCGIEGKHATNYQRQLFKSMIPLSVDFLKGRKIIMPASTLASSFPFQ